jgi:hypothetical protein
MFVWLRHRSTNIAGHDSAMDPRYYAWVAPPPSTNVAGHGSAMGPLRVWFRQGFAVTVVWRRHWFRYNGCVAPPRIH